MLSGECSWSSSVGHARCQVLQSHSKTSARVLKRGYTPGMKTAVSIPDKLFRKADALARRLGKSRSQVYREALAEWVARREPDAVTVALDEAVEELGVGIDTWTAEAGRAVLERTEW